MMEVSYAVLKGTKVFGLQTTCGLKILPIFTSINLYDEFLSQMSIFFRDFDIELIGCEKSESFFKRGKIGTNDMNSYFPIVNPEISLYHCGDRIALSLGEKDGS